MAWSPADSAAPRGRGRGARLARQPAKGTAGWAGARGGADLLRPAPPRPGRNQRPALRAPGSRPRTPGPAPGGLAGPPHLSARASPYALFSALHPRGHSSASMCPRLLIWQGCDQPLHMSSTPYQRLHVSSTPYLAGLRSTTIWRPSFSPGPWPCLPGRAKPAGPAGPARAEPRGITKAHLKFLVPEFRIDAFSTSRVLNQAHLIVLDRAIAVAIPRIVF